MASLLACANDLVMPLLAASQSASQSGSAAGGVVVLGFMCCFGLFGFVALGFWIWMLVDCAGKKFQGDNEKLIWILVIVLAGGIGALVYYFVGRPKGTSN